jgi:hypothetical protein
MACGLGVRTEMGMRIKILLVVALIICVPIIVSCQDSQTIFTQLEQSIRAQEPTWRVDWKSINDPLSAAIRWRPGKSKSYVLVSLRILYSPEQATHYFDDLVAEQIERVGNNRSKYRKIKLPSMGDDNYLWTFPNGNPEIYVRKGRIFVTVDAQSVSIAKRFAKLVVHQIPAI